MAKGCSGDLQRLEMGALMGAEALGGASEVDVGAWVRILSAGTVPLVACPER